MQECLNYTSKIICNQLSNKSQAEVHPGAAGEHPNPLLPLSEHPLDKRFFRIEVTENCFSGSVTKHQGRSHRKDSELRLNLTLKFSV
jgi:hypothetical protein